MPHIRLWEAQLERPIMKFVTGGLLGLFASFSISFGLLPVIAALAAVVFFGIAWKSHAAISGAVSGFGLTWLVLGGSTYMRCVSRAPDCVPSEASVRFLVLAFSIFFAGAAVGLVGIVRDRAKRQPGDTR